MADTVSCTGETLSFSPSTNPTLTDDSVSGTGKYLAKEHVVGGNAAAAPAASCPIEERRIPEKGRRPSSKRPALFSSSDEEDEDHLEARGKGKGRLTRLPGTKPKTNSCPTSRVASPSAAERARAPRRPLEPEGASSTDDGPPKTEPYATRERSPKRSASVRKEEGEEKPKRPNDGRSTGPVSTIFQHQREDPHGGPRVTLSAGA